MLVEGEIGDIGTGSEIHEASPDLTKELSTPEEARRFVESTGVDILAPAVGNMHGMLRSMVQGETKKHFERIAAIKRAAQVFLTSTAVQEPMMKTYAKPSWRESTLFTSIQNFGSRGDTVWNRA
jgi:fructose/tagatose bisphosphate aldolase